MSEPADFGPSRDGEHSPGDEPADDAGHFILNGTFGLGLSVVLTAAAFWLAEAHVIYAPSVPVALSVLAIAQMGVHLVFFLHITTGPDNTNNVLALAFGLLVVFVIVVGSIWIMDHLETNMMPQPIRPQRDVLAGCCKTF